MLKGFINDSAQSNHWIAGAIFNEVLEVDGSLGANDVDLDMRHGFATILPLRIWEQI